MSNSDASSAPEGRIGAESQYGVRFCDSAVMMATPQHCRSAAQPLGKYYTIFS
jgi:hypothetical protein